MKAPTICVTVGCYDVGSGYMPNELFAIARVFRAAAVAAHAKRHGSIECWHDGELLAGVTIDLRGPGAPADTNVPPVLQEIEVEESGLYLEMLRKMTSSPKWNRAPRPRSKGGAR